MKKQRPRLTCGDCQAMKSLDPTHVMGDCVNPRSRRHLKTVSRGTPACNRLIPMEQKLLVFKEPKEAQP